MDADSLGGTQSLLAFLQDFDPTVLDWPAIATDLDRRRRVIQTTAERGVYTDPAQLETMAKELDILIRLQARVNELVGL